MGGWWKRLWGGSAPVRLRARELGWIDLVALVSTAGLVFAIVSVARHWTGELRPVVEIDLSPLALPKYAFYSLTRALIAYVFSLVFSLLYGYWAARSRPAEVVLLPLLDVLQSVPVLAFMPGLVLALVTVFPHSNVGLELAAVLMIFSSQAWNLTFSFYSSLRSLPAEQLEAATVFRFGWRRRLAWVELPAAAMGLVWNSIVSMANAWFFLMINEAFVLGDRDFRLPGLGSYMHVALARGDRRAMAFGVLAMVALIVALDQLLWRPAVAWARRFRSDETEGEEAGEPQSWFLDLLRRVRLFRQLGGLARALGGAGRPRRRWVAQRTGGALRRLGRLAGLVSLALFAALLVLLAAGAVGLLGLIEGLGSRAWGDILLAALATLGRVLASTALATLWTLPVGLLIGLDPRRSRLLQPVVQVVASFPAPMLFPLVIAGFHGLGVPLGGTSIVLLMLGTQWYILFNVIAGAMAIPADLRLAARGYRIGGLRLLWYVYLPAVFPHLVTGWVTATGGAWNASIVAEYVSFRGQVLTTNGLGAMITSSAERADFATLAASVVVMAGMVVVFNRTVWKRLYERAEERFALGE